MTRRYELTPELLEAVVDRARNNEGKEIETGLIADVENMAETLLESRPDLRPEEDWTVTFRYCIGVKAHDLAEAKERAGKQFDAEEARGHHFSSYWLKPVVEKVGQ